jgi:MoaA/NifB/PqqE/SkfB family radical SAM enzyme
MPVFFRLQFLSMKRQPSFRIEVDGDGRLILPPELVQRYHLTPGAILSLEEGVNGLWVRRPVTDLARVYVEPTNSCNLGCSTCMRNVWDEPLGFLSERTFERLLHSLEDLHPKPLVFFGGFGEPLSHPKILDMVAAVKAMGCAVELITNGTLLTGEVSSRLIALGLDRLWVSLDGATPQSYADVRLGDMLPHIKANLEHLRDLRSWAYVTHPKIGIAFVAMQRNIADLPEVLRLGRLLGADQFSISNVLAHTPELRREVLYERTLNDAELQSSDISPLVSLPWMDVDETTLPALSAVLKGGFRLRVAQRDLERGTSLCPFVERGSLSLRWDGKLSPCLPLLHSHESYLDDRHRRVTAFSVGDIHASTLAEIWMDPAYLALRQRLHLFDFSPCAFCNSCEQAGDNLEDCFGNSLPTCGGCLWAQGLIQCP